MFTLNIKCMKWMPSDASFVPVVKNGMTILWQTFTKADSGGMLDVLIKALRALKHTEQPMRGWN